MQYLLLIFLVDKENIKVMERKIIMQVDPVQNESHILRCPDCKLDWYYIDRHKLLH